MRQPLPASRIVLLCLLGVFTLGASPAAQSMAARSSSVASDPEVEGAKRLFSAWLEGQILYRDLPGIAVGVVSDQELVWATGFGLADRAGKIPMTPQTKFRMASHSKLFTATAVMQLREQGKLRLDDPVSKYLPWFTLKAAEPDDPPITIEELLTHSSGLPREAGSHWTTFNFPTSEELRGLMADRQAPFAPEVQWKYSNLAFSIAGMINTVGQAVAKAATRPPASIAWDPSWSRFAGLYRGRGGDSQVVELNKRLVVITPSGANLDTPIQLEPIGAGQFRYVAPTGGGPVGEIVRFVEENGRVVRMITGDSYVERVRP
jgi:hypothetical protein